MTGRRLTDAEIARECAQMREEDAWPRWPVLPVKNLYRNPNQRDRLGILVAGTSTVVLMGLFDLRSGPLDEQVRDRPREEYATLEELVAAGWVGD